MAARRPDDRHGRATRMDELLLERERLDQVIKNSFSREVTIFFSDICGFTCYTDQRGDLQCRSMLLKHNQIVLPAIKAHEGSVIEVVGDGVMAAFDEPLHAVNAAVDIQHRLKRHNDAAGPDEAIHVKIGINSGKVLLDEGADFQSLTGDVANVAARIQAHAGGDEILLSRSVAEQTEERSEWRYRFHNDVVFKGKANSISVYRVVWDETEKEQSSQLPEPIERPSPLDPVERPDSDDTILNIEINHEDRHLKIRISESRQGEENTIRHYETVPYDASEIEARCRRLVETLNKANRRGRMEMQTLGQLREIGQVLYDSLLSLNAKEALCKSEAKNLVLSIDDQLVHIPWELLYDGKQFFCLRFCMGRVVSTRQTPASLNGRPLAAPIEMLILADPTGDLKNAYAEGTQIRDFLDQSPDLINATLRTDYVSAETLKAKLRNYDLIHFAGHADYNPQKPESAGWRLRDSSLTTEDIQQMAGSAVMPKMVFANACQSARTEKWTLGETFEQEIFGLANAFLLSGVKHYIGTFWEILDEPGSHFAMEFYKHLFSGVTVGEAVLNARRALIDLYGEETIIWASYVFYGDPTFNYMARVKAGSQPASSLKRGGYIKPIGKDRTREEIIDFENGRKGSALARFWPAALIALLLLAAGIWAIPWYEGRQIAELEQKALAHYSAGEYDLAAKLCGDLQKQAPGQSTSALILGNISLSRGQLDDAGRYFKTALDSRLSNGKTKAKALLGLGRLASINSQTEQALSHYHQAAGFDPTNVGAVLSQAIVLERQGKYTDALSAYNLASTMAPDNAGLQVAAGQIRGRLAAMEDEARQARIDRLVEELLADQRAAPAPSSDTWSSSPPTVWLLDFNTSGFSPREGVDRLIHGLVTDALVTNGRIKLVERGLLDKLLAELRLGTSRLADGATALSVGRLLAARVMVAGHLHFSSNQLRASLRMIDCETGMIRASLSEVFDQIDTLDAVAEKLYARLIDQLLKQYPVRTTVSAVRGDTVSIDAGLQQGVRPGMLFTDPDGRLTLRVVSVKDEESEANAIAGLSAAQPGLRLQQSPPKAE